MRTRFTLWILLCLLASPAQAELSVKDDLGNLVVLRQPAQRIISMAPHVTELLFAAGGGKQIAGTIGYSDYPEAAKLIPRIGTDRQVDLERVLALKPDLLVIWQQGSSSRQLLQLRNSGIPIFFSEPRALADIPSSMIRLGHLLGTDDTAQAAAAALKKQIDALTKKYAERSRVRLFYQVWDRPLYTLNGQHIVNDAIRICGGENIFAQLEIAAPIVSIEAVLQKNPEAIFGSAETNPADGGVNIWRRYPTLKAVQRDNLFLLNGTLLNRAGPRMIAGAVALCEKLEQARRHLAGKRTPTR